MFRTTTFPPPFFAPNPVIYNDSTVLISNVRLFDAQAGLVNDDQNVLIAQGNIIDVGTEIVIPGDAVIIDGGEHTLLPGRVMVHEHLFICRIPSASLIP